MAGGYRVLVTTLTKKMAEDLTDYLAEQGVRVQYLHSDVDTMARIEILRELRLGAFDVLVGINLLREGLDLPEVALVAILDADKEGFLRSASSLIQTMGRAARNVNGRVVMYADTITDSMTHRHRRDPASAGPADRLQRGPRDRPPDHHQVGDRHPRAGPGRGRRVGRHHLRGQRAAGGRGGGRKGRAGGVDPRAAAAEMAQALGPDADELSSLVHRLDVEMNKAAEELRFEEAALLRDEIAELRALLVRDPVDGSADPGGRHRRRRRRRRVLTGRRSPPSTPVSSPNG